MAKKAKKKPEPAARALKARRQPRSAKVTTAKVTTAKVTTAKATTSRRAARAPAVVPPVRMSGALTVVGVGASAGGLEAFSQILRACRDAKHSPSSSSSTSSPHHESALVSLLTVQTPLTVVQAEEGMRVEAEHVYVIPPNVQMEMRGAELHLSPRPADRSRHTPIDAFLVSLAESVQERSVAVILSGTASDGAHRAGRREARRRHHLRAIAGVGEVRRHAARRDRHRDGRSGAAAGGDRRQAGGARRARPRAGDDVRRRSRRGARQPAADLRRARPVSGVDFRHYKLPTIKRRLFRRMALHRINDVGDYLQLLREQRQRSAQPLPGSADPRDAVLPRSGVVRRAGVARVPSRSSRAGGRISRSASGSRDARPARKPTRWRSR